MDNLQRLVPARQKGTLYGQHSMERRRRNPANAPRHAVNSKPVRLFQAWR
jgi:hypothetical protein